MAFAFQGYTGHLAGPYVVTRTIAIDSGGVAAFDRIDFRTAAWFGACPQLSAADKLAAVARGIVKRVEVWVPGGGDIYLSDLDVAAPGDMHEQVPGWIGTGRAVCRYSTQAARTFIRLASPWAQDHTIKVEFEILPTP